jgi:hypothetical protein
LGGALTILIAAALSAGSKVVTTVADCVAVTISLSVVTGGVVATCADGLPDGSALALPAKLAPPGIALVAVALPSSVIVAERT